MEVKQWSHYVCFEWPADSIIHVSLAGKYFSEKEEGLVQRKTVVVHHEAVNDGFFAFILWSDLCPSEFEVIDQWKQRFNDITLRARSQFVSLRILDSQPLEDVKVLD